MVGDVKSSGPIVYLMKEKQIVDAARSGSEVSVICNLQYIHVISRHLV